MSREDIEELRFELEEKERTINSLKKQLQAFSITAISDLHDSEDDLLSKIKVFSKTNGFNLPENPAQTRIHFQKLAVNSIFTVFHLENSPELCLSSAPLDSKALASTIAFNYALQFVSQQIDHHRFPLQHRPGLNFPLQWLLGIFPTNQIQPHTSTSSSDSPMWLPLHLALAIDVREENLPEYLDDLQLLLSEFGESSWEEDVSPLTIAVAKARPSLRIIEAIVNYRPDALLHEDEDGSLPMMHAASCNEDRSIVAYMVEREPRLLEYADNFGCKAIHYASFSGTSKMVEFLVDQQEELANAVEGNGALPLHDAVQNSRGPIEQYDIVQVLLQISPQSAQKRNDEGAFPLHLAAKSSTLTVFEAVYNAFPAAVYAIDAEGLLPLHYYSGREDRSQHMDIQQFVLSKNPKSEIKTDEELFSNKRQSQATAGNRSSWTASWLTSSLRTSVSNSNQPSATPSATASIMNPPPTTTTTTTTTTNQSKPPGKKGRASVINVSAMHKKRMSVATLNK
jgi:ankyrin repeat protein